MIEGKRNEGRCWPPNGNDFAADVTAADADEHGKAYQPVGTDCAQEDLMPFWILGFLGCECYCSVAVCWGLFEYTSVACDDCHEKEAASEVAKEGDRPILRYVEDSNSTVQERGPRWGCQ